MKFFDSYGKEVVEGSIIIIEHTYSNQNFTQNQEAIVKWDSKNGLLTWSILNSNILFQDQDFYGVHKFKLKE